MITQNTMNKHTMKLKLRSCQTFGYRTKKVFFTKKKIKYSAFYCTERGGLISVWSNGRPYRYIYNVKMPTSVAELKQIAKSAMDFRRRF